MYTLGINAAFHDSSACLVRNGIVVAAAEEERFTRIKHAKRPIPFSAYELPFHAIDYCLAEARIVLADVEHIAYSFDPGLNPVHMNFGANATKSDMGGDGETDTFYHEDEWYSLFLSYIINAPRHLVDGVPHHLQRRFAKVDPARSFKWHFVAHHLAHAVSAFYPSPFDKAALLVADGRGELATTSYGIGKGCFIDIFEQVHMPHSLGMLYEEVTTYLGFLRSSDEYKVMALASSGRPEYLADFRQLISFPGHGQYRLAPINLEKQFGPARKRGEPFCIKHYDIAHSLQKFLEETMLELVAWLHDKTRATNLCMAGGVALNCVMNARIRDKSRFERIWIQPAASDAGTSLGAALWIDQQMRNDSSRPYVMDHAYLGPSFSDEEIEEQLRRAKLTFHKPDNLLEEVADLLVRDKVVGWFQGRMEFGPRALGARSILASPLKADMQMRLNEIKDREDFRPVAPVVREDQASEWFTDIDSEPFMLFVNNVREDKIRCIPAICHVDGTARVQTIRREQNPLYYDLVTKFGEKTGIGVLINTSFNTRGQPIVCTPADAIACFFTSPVDVLAIGPYVLLKE